MNRTRTMLAILGVVIVGVGLYFALPHRPSWDRPAPQPAPDLELFTITGSTSVDSTVLSGRWHTAPEGAAPAPAGDDAARREAMDAMGTLPYVQGSQPAPAVSSVTVYEHGAAEDGVNIYCSGHGPEAFAMNMRGEILHTWRYPLDAVWPDVPETVHGEFWRRVHVWPDGGLLAIFEGIGMIRLDRDSNLLWAFHGGCHHQAFVASDGTIYALTRRAERLPDVSERPVLVDYIAVLDAEGHMREEHSLIECMKRSRYSDLLRGSKRGGDIFHTNSLWVVSSSDAAADSLFHAGEVLVSMRTIDVIALVDLAKDRITWAASGNRRGGFWSKQHDARVLGDGDILLFDNRGNRGKSRVAAFDPQSLAVAWQYTGSADAPLLSETCGTAQRLTGGNTLITESDAGRAIEVTPDLRVVWEFYNPHRAGDAGDLIATLFALERVPPAYFDWIGSR